jgi:hypothetical protein
LFFIGAKSEASGQRIDRRFVIKAGHTRRKGLKSYSASDWDAEQPGRRAKRSPNKSTGFPYMQSFYAGKLINCLTTGKQFVNKSSTAQMGRCQNGAPEWFDG